MTAAIYPIDLQTQYGRIQRDLDSRVQAVFAHGKFILGPEVAQFETEIAALCNARHAVGLASGHTALVIGLWAAGVGPGDKVYVPAFSYCATAGAVTAIGAVPVFVDVDPRTFLMDPTALARAILEVEQTDPDSSRAIMPVDLFGLAADYSAINAIARQHGLIVVADAAQGLGATRDGRPVGALADVTATSFFPTKPLGAAGDGGCLLTNDAAIAERARSMRTHGQDTGDERQMRPGLTGRLDTLQAAVLLAKLPIFRDEIARREAVARTYDAALEAAVTVPARPNGATSAWAQYAVLTSRRDDVLAALRAAEVPARVFYRYPLPEHPEFAAKGITPRPLTTAPWLSERVLNLPMHPYVSDDQIAYVSDTIREALGVSQRA